ncbi:DNA primase family protein [Flavobacterium psychrotrophum]|uniref:DNA primase family protein n=1 Tax=Flavobacterium psychrotrophum TaxID=2294119 RepID=UPI000E311953|nr:DNA primase family protein [Flavobacterium psychrotrophum]
MQEENIPVLSILAHLQNKIQPIKFASYFDDTAEINKLQKKHYLIPVVDNLLNVTNQENYSLCRKNEVVYLFNGEYWQQLDTPIFKDFLGEVALQSGTDKYDARFFQFKDDLLKQFMSDASLKEIHLPEKVLINLKNGTFEISEQNQELRGFNKSDFMTYQLPFSYDSSARCPKFTNFLNQVLPDKELQLVLAEYLGYIFIRNKVLKLEKVLILYGSGANGKSVLFEIINALVGKQNISVYSLQSLTDSKGYNRAMISHKLLNYATEINGKLDTAVFKQLCSGEPVEARLPYGMPLTIEDYARLIFNCNELPKEIEHTDAYFRRFLIIPFKITIPPEKQDKELATKIIEDELSGIFNWIIEGLQRLLANRNFTHSSIIENQVKKYRVENDSILMFLEEENYEKSILENIKLAALYLDYKIFCQTNGFIASAERAFSKKLDSLGYERKRTSLGYSIYIKKK